MPWKKLCADISEDPEAQKVLRAYVLEHPELLLRVAEHAHGRPHQSMDLDMADRRMIVWPTRVATDADLED